MRSASDTTIPSGPRTWAMPDVLVFAHAAHEFVALRREPIEDRLKVVHLEPNVAQPELVGHRPGRSRYVVRTDEAGQLEPRPSAGGRSMTISLREFGMPMTVSMNSPSTNVLSSTSHPSATKNAVTASRSATAMPTWSKGRIPGTRTSCISRSRRPEYGPPGPFAVSKINGSRRRLRQPCSIARTGRFRGPTEA